MCQVTVDHDREQLLHGVVFIAVVVPAPETVQVSEQWNVISHVTEARNGCAIA